jgi:hypothetical protein
MKTTHLAILCLAVLAVAVPGEASNMAFALPVQIGGTGQIRTFLALPLEYAVSPVTAEGMCLDLGGSAKVTSVMQWNEATSQFVVHPCGSGSNNFTLVEGIAYGVLTASGQTTDALIVGANDDAFSYSIAPTSTSNLTWVSIPYHQAIPDIAGTSGVVDAEDLCQSIGPAVAAVVRWDATISAYVAHACGSAFDTPFPITLGEGYGLVNAPGQTITWQPPHY